MPPANDLRIGRYDIRVTADAGASVTFTWPEGWESVTWTATLGETSLTVNKDGLDVTVTITAEQATALGGRPGTWTLKGDGVPEICGTVYPSADGSHHGNTAETSTIIVDDAAVTVTVIGAAPSGNLATVATTGDYTDLANRPPRPGAIRFREGHYSYLSPATASTVVASLGFCALVPFDMDEPGEMDSISIEVTNAGHADSLLRLGAYTDDGSHVWGDELLVDGGTVTGASTGFKTVTFDPVSLSVGRYWIAVAFQGTISPSPTLRAAAAGPYAGRTLTGLSFANAVGYASGVTGALPDTIDAPAGRLGCPQVALTGSPLS